MINGTERKDLKNLSKSWKEFDNLENIDQNCSCLNYYNVSVNKYN